MTWSRWLLLVGLVPLLGCAHSEAKKPRTFRSKTLCHDVRRVSERSIFRAGFSGELSVNEQEAIQEVEQTYLRYTAMKLDYPEENSKNQIDNYVRSLKRKKALLDELEASYQAYTGSVNASVVQMSHYRIGEAYEQLANDIENTRADEGATEAEKTKFCDDLFQKTAGLRSKALENFRACAERSKQGDGDSIWSNQCDKKLGQLE